MQQAVTDDEDDNTGMDMLLQSSSKLSVLKQPLSGRSCFLSVSWPSFVGDCQSNAYVVGKSMEDGDKHSDHDERMMGSHNEEVESGCSRKELQNTTKTIASSSSFLNLKSVCSKAPPCKVKFKLIGIREIKFGQV